MVTVDKGPYQRFESFLVNHIDSYRQTYHEFPERRRSHPLVQVPSVLPAKERVIDSQLLFENGNSELSSTLNSIILICWSGPGSWDVFNEAVGEPQHPSIVR